MNKRRVWVVEFEESNEDLMNDYNFGIIKVTDEGIVYRYHGIKEILLPWKVIEKKEV